jgi:hypothetical protein
VGVAKEGNMTAFTNAELKFVQDVCHELGFEGKVPVLETVEEENDAISCAEGFTIIKVETVAVTLTGTAVYGSKFVVSETVWVPATRNEPECCDYNDFATVPTLSDAVKAMLLRSYEYKINNVLDGIAMAASYGNPEEL